MTVENTGESELTVTIRYFRQDGPEPILVSEEPEGGVRLIHPAAQEFSIGAGEIKQLTLAFNQKADRLPSALNGQLAIRAQPIDQPDGGGAGDVADQEAQSGADEVANLLVNVTGTVAPIEDVAFEPSSISLQATEWLGPTVASGTKAQVILRGPGVPGFVAAQALAATHVPESNSDSTPYGVGEIADDWDRVRAPVTLLGNDSGDQVVLQLTDLTLRGSDWASATVEVASGVHAGSYSGQLTLSPSLETPALTLTVHSRHAFPWLVLTVLLGSLLGGLLPLLSAIWTRRRLLWAELDGIANSYFTELDRLTQGTDDEDDLPLWNLDFEVGKTRPPYGKEWIAIPTVEGARGLHAELTWANSKAQLEDLGERVGELAREVEKWLMVAPEAKALLDVSHQRVAIRPDRKRFRSTKLYAQTLNLLARTHDKPATIEDAKTLVLQLDRQRRLNQQALDLNNAIADDQLNQHLTPEQRRLLAALDLADVTEPATDIDKRTDAEWADLFVAATAKDLERQAIVAGEIKEGQVVEGSAVMARLGEWIEQVLFADNQGQAAALEQARLRARPSQPKAQGSNFADAARAVSVQQGAVTAVTVVATAAIYALDPYSSTWGSFDNYGAAFAAGFGTQVFAQWAVQPIFDARRVRKSQGAASGASGAAPGAVGGSEPDTGGGEVGPGQAKKSESSSVPAAPVAAASAPTVEPGPS
jgi:hypothetical protein